MDHTHIVRAGDLDRYAPTRDSQEVIPELVYWLVKQACPDLTICRIPYGDAVNQPGWDGVVETVNGFLEFVPRGKSYWEIGSGSDPQSKATRDFKKRTDENDDEQRANSSYVFVTPRSSGSGGWNEPEQTKWLERRKDKGWKQIRVIDGVKLADWMREFPAIGKWMATKLSITAILGGVSTAIEHWENMLSECQVGDPPFPPKLFTIGRKGACEALEAVFKGKKQVLMLFAESQQDVVDFVSAFLASLETDTSRIFGDRCLYIREEQAWRSIVETRSPHVLVADPRLGLETEEGAALQTIACRKGHAVVVPLCGAWSGNNPEILKLRSPSKSLIESVLKESGYTDIRAIELARIGGDRISALRRYLRGYGNLPPYATWGNATLIAQAGLVGNWDGANTSDCSALEILLGKVYGEWIEILRSDLLRSDSPLVQTAEKWRLVPRGEAWISLGHRITDDDLDRFQEMAVNVLSEQDPQFDLPKEERFTASIHGKVFAHSLLLRKGIAETLALLGSNPKALSSCSDGNAENTAVLIVRRLLKEKSWECWASLDSIMPLLAEAAPNEFLNSVSSALLDLNDTPFHSIFGEEGSGGLNGGNYMSGLLWALESLAWSPVYLSRVAIILAEIASIDPGGSWANRPSNSLANIFLPWHLQTTAQFDKRVSAVEAVIMEQPVVGWELLLSMLPHNHGSTMGCHRPTWRDFIPRDWKDRVLRTEYWDQITAYTNLAVSLAKKDSKKLCVLLEKLSDLPKAARESILDHLNSGSIVSLPEIDRLPIWESLQGLVRRHRKYSDADWALPEDIVKRIEDTAQSLAPLSPEFKYHHLFDDRDYDLFDEKGNYELQRKQLEKSRENAILEIIRNGTLEAAMQFAEEVAAPYEVGRALGVVASNEMEASMLPSLLDSENDTYKRVLAGFVWARFRTLQTKWVDSVLGWSWSSEHQAKFLTFLPFDQQTWIRVVDNLSGTQEALYWENVRVNPYGSDCDLTPAVKKLLEYGREGAAVMCVSHMASVKSNFNESLALDALLAVLSSKDGIKELDQYQTVELIKYLQDSTTTDKDALFQIEWNFLPWLDRFSSGSPVTLEKRLSSDPTFFAETIGLVFRSSNVSEDDIEESDAHRKNLARNAYRLLTEWKRCPGTKDDGSFSIDEFNNWLNEARRLTEESGHTEVAQIQIGHVLTCAPPDPNGLWIHNTVASALNFRDTTEMRSGYTTQLFNDRGVHGFTHGKEERILARENREKAEVLDSKGYTRFASAMREFADQYEREAEHEEQRSPFEE